MILPAPARQNFPFSGDLQALGVGFIGFDTHILFRGAFDNNRKSFWPMFRPAGDSITNGDEFKQAIETPAQKLLIEIFRSPAQVKFKFDAVAFFKEGRGFYRLDFQIVITGPDLHLKRFRLCLVCIGSRLLLLLVLEVLELAEIHNLGDWWIGCGRHLNQVGPPIIGFHQSL